MPEFKGSWFICTKLFRLMPRKLRLLQMANGIVVDLSDPPQFSMAKKPNGVIEPAATDFVKKHLLDSDVFLDVGANWGYFSCVACRAVGIKGLVISVEPSAATFLRLLDTIVRNRAFNVWCINAAVADTFGLTSIIKQWFRQSTSAHMAHKMTAAGQSTLTVPVDWIMDNIELSSRRLRIIKIDAEGAELLVLKGAANTLKKHKPFIIVEISEEDCKRFNNKPEDVYDFMDSVEYIPLYFLDNSGNGEIRNYEKKSGLVGQVIFGSEAIK